jgi:2-polyprenyl-3-methyl-5-hydroxy-6-metoxy-1,4-benzoquinol methylase
MEVYTIYMGDRLGLYRALSQGPATASELAARTRTSERYIREWLEQQAVAGILGVENGHPDAAARRYFLPPGHAEVLLDRDSLAYLTPLAGIATGIAGQMPALVDAFRSGRGVPYSAFGQEAREGQAALNRPAYINLLGSQWLPSVPDVHARLQADPPARIADVGCGAGWSSVAVARAYPKARVDGYDLDEPSIAMARANAAEAGVSDRVSFHARDASDPNLSGRYDLVVAFETIHDMGRPVEALRTMRRLAGKNGAVIVMDERVEESFSAPSHEIERFMYGASVLFCLPTGLADEPSVGTGTVMRPATLRNYAQQAGFKDVEVLPIQHDFWRFYRLV